MYTGELHRSHLAAVKASSFWCCGGKGTTRRWREVILLYLAPHLGCFEIKSRMLGLTLGPPVPDKTDFILEQRAEDGHQDA